MNGMDGETAWFVPLEGMAIHNVSQLIESESFIWQNRMHQSSAPAEAGTG